jgi:hypothetical protein
MEGNNQKTKNQEHQSSSTNYKTIASHIVQWWLYIFQLLHQKSIPVFQIYKQEPNVILIQISHIAISMSPTPNEISSIYQRS